MNVNSTEKERYLEIKDKILKITHSIPNKEVSITDENETFSHALRRHAEELNIYGTTVKMDGLDIPAIFTKKTLGESINLTVRRMGDLKNLDKLLTNLTPILENAILIEKESFRHKSLQKAKNVEYVAQFVSAFHDGTYIYPTKIAATKMLKGADSSILKLTISLNKISLQSILKDSPDTELHPDISGEGPLSWDSVLNISLASFVKFFNTKDSILIKNFPDQMLSETQKAIKQVVKDNDSFKEESIYRSMNIKKQEDIFEEYSDPITEYEPQGDDFINILEENLEEDDFEY